MSVEVCGKLTCPVASKPTGNLDEEAQSANSFGSASSFEHTHDLGQIGLPLAELYTA